MPLTSRPAGSELIPSACRPTRPRARAGLSCLVLRDLGCRLSSPGTSPHSMRASRAESQSRPADLGAGASWPAAAPPRGRRATGLRTSVELRRDPGVLGLGACCGPSPLGRDHSRPWGDWSSRPLPPSALHAFASSLSRPSRPRASVQHVGWDGPPALHLFACSMCPHFVAIWIVFSIPPPFFVSYSYRVAHGPRPHSPPLRGEILAPTATDVLRNGVHSPGIHSGGPTSIFAGFRS